MSRIVMLTYQELINQKYKDKPFTLDPPHLTDEEYWQTREHCERIKRAKIKR